MFYWPFPQIPVKSLWSHNLWGPMKNENVGLFVKQLKNYNEIQDGDSIALNKVGSPFKHNSDIHEVALPSWVRSSWNSFLIYCQLQLLFPLCFWQLSAVIWSLLFWDSIFSTVIGEPSLGVSPTNSPGLQRRADTELLGDAGASCTIAILVDLQFLPLKSAMTFLMSVVHLILTSSH